MNCGFNPPNPRHSNPAFNSVHRPIKIREGSRFCLDAHANRETLGSPVIYSVLIGWKATCSSRKSERDRTVSPWNLRHHYSSETTTSRYTGCIQIDDDVVTLFGITSRTSDDTQ